MTMDADNWNKLCNVFNLDVQVTVKKTVDRSDILQTLVNEGELIFKGENGSWTQICLKNRKGELAIDQIKLLETILWDPVKEYLKKQKSQQNKNNKETSGSRVIKTEKTGSADTKTKLDALRGKKE